MLERVCCTVWGIDRDPEAIARGAALGRLFPGRLELLHGRFGLMDRLLAERGVSAVDGVAMDLGISSLQIEAPERGFSFRTDGPLDMRMEKAGTSAADVVNRTSEAELARIIRAFGEERRARAVARAIVAARTKAPITRTGELAAIVRRVVAPAADGLDPATRTFQALRIYVNDEVGELKRGLSAAERLLRAGGRIAVVCFQSLEDRLVKRFLLARSGAAPRPSRHAPHLAEAVRAPSFSLLFRRPRRPAPAEIAANPRARSARLRAAERTAASAWPAEEEA